MTSLEDFYEMWDTMYKHPHKQGDFINGLPMILLKDGNVEVKEAITVETLYISSNSPYLNSFYASQGIDPERPMEYEPIYFWVDINNKGLNVRHTLMNSRYATMSENERYEDVNLQKLSYPFRMLTYLQDHWQNLTAEGTLLRMALESYCKDLLKLPVYKRLPEMTSC